MCSLSGRFQTASVLLLSCVSYGLGGCSLLIDGDRFLDPGGTPMDASDRPDEDAGLVDPGDIGAGPDQGPDPDMGLILPEMCPASEVRIDRVLGGTILEGVGSRGHPHPMVVIGCNLGPNPMVTPDRMGRLNVGNVQVSPDGRMAALELRNPVNSNLDSDETDQVSLRWAVLEQTPAMVEVTIQGLDELDLDSQGQSEFSAEDFQAMYSEIEIDGNIRFEGDAPIHLFATSQIQIHGTIDAGGQSNGAPGPGGCRGLFPGGSPGSCGAQDGQSSDNLEGGGGGGNQSPGFPGSSNTQGGAALALDGTLIDLMSYRGGGGGAGDEQRNMPLNPTESWGGGGGGLLALTTLGRIDFGNFDNPGISVAGGDADAPSDCSRPEERFGGGGGGAGGALLLRAFDELRLEQDARIDLSGGFAENVPGDVEFTCPERIGGEGGVGWLRFDAPRVDPIVTNPRQPDLPSPPLRGPMFARDIPVIVDADEPQTFEVQSGPGTYGVLLNGALIDTASAPSVSVTMPPGLHQLCLSITIDPALLDREEAKNCIPVAALPSSL